MRLSGLLLLALPALASSHYFARPHPRSYFQIASIAEGPDGLLWLATTSGLHHFDGHRYSPIPGFPWPSAEFIAPARDGSMWIGHSQRGLLRYDPSTGFRAMLTESVNSLAIVDAGVVVSVRNSHILVGSSGVTRRQPGLCALGKTPLPEASAARWMNCGGVAAQISLSSDRTREMPRLFPRRPNPVAAPEWARQLWLATQREVRGFSPADSLPLPTGASAVSAIGEDSRGHVWVAGMAGDLWEFVPQAGLEQWTAADLGSTPVQVVRDFRGELYAVTEQRLLRFDESVRAWKPLSPSQHSIDYALPLPEGGFLASLSNFGLARLSPDGRLRQRIDAPLPLFPEAIIYPKTIRPHNDFRELFRAPDGRILVGNKQALLTLKDGTLRREELPEIPALTASYPVDLGLDLAGRVVVGYELGLARWEEGWRRLPASPALTQVRSFSFRLRDEVWVAHRMKGYFSRLSGNQVTHFTVDQGYTPADTQFLKVDSRGWVWRGTSEGVYVCNGTDLSPADWLHLPIAGESRQYGFFEDRDQTVWIAGEEGLVHLRPDSAWFAAPTSTPRLQSVRIDGHAYTSFPSTLETVPRKIQVQLAGLAAGLRPDAVRYRVAPTQMQWQPVTNGIIELTSLSNGDRRLEIAHLGNGAVPVAFHFRIGTPWYQSLRMAWLLLPAGIAVWLWRRWNIPYWIHKAWFVARRRWARPADEGDGSELRTLQGSVLQGRYRLTDLISSSALSTVYRAHDQTGNETVVVKILHQSAGEHQWVRSRFAQEVAALHSIRHPGVVALLDSWILPEGYPCLAMPFLAGPTLREELSGGPWPKHRVAQFARRLGAAIGTVHQAGIVHRDLKPENILVLPGDQPVLIDFGNAGLLGSGEEMGSTRLLAGSLRYLAPERLTGHYSPASDIYGLGVILLELLTLTTLEQLPTSITGDGFAAALKQRLAEVGATAVTQTLVDGLRVDPNHRPSNAARWTEEIANALGLATGASST